MPALFCRSRNLRNYLRNRKLCPLVNYPESAKALVNHTQIVLKNPLIACDWPIEEQRRRTNLGLPLKAQNKKRISVGIAKKWDTLVTFQTQCMFTSDPSADGNGAIAVTNVLFLRIFLQNFDHMAHKVFTIVQLSILYSIVPASALSHPL